MKSGEKSGMKSGMKSSMNGGMKTDIIPHAVARAVTINRRAIAHTKYRL